MNKKLFGISVTVIIVIILVVVASKNISIKNSEQEMKINPSTMTNTNDNVEKETMMPKAETMVKEEGAMMKDEPKMEAKDSMMMEKYGSYKDYSPEILVEEQKNGKKVVLFFHATWCPYCKAADTDFKEHAEKIPAGVTVLKTDYDSQTELKKKYGVTYQHTFVQIDNNGNQITKWVSGDTTLLVQNIK